MLFNTFPISKLSNYTRTCSFTNRVATIPVRTGVFAGSAKCPRERSEYTHSAHHAHTHYHIRTNPMEHTRMYTTVLTLYTETREYEDENLLKSSQNFDKILPVVEA